MEQFTFSDIFDTKGIEYIIVISFFLLLIPFWRFLNRPLKLKRVAAQQAGVLSPGILNIPGGLFFSKNHTWSQLERSGIARVGMDDLLLHLTGGVSVDYLVDQGAEVKKGEVVARLVQGKKKLDVASPLSGEVKSLNSLLLDEPATLSESPYDAWLCKIEPGQWKEETQGSLLAGEASQWIRDELDRFKDFMAGVLSPEAKLSTEVVLQEGGELTDHPLAECDQEVWNEFQVHFLGDKA